jgi:hypothetical protein
MKTITWCWPSPQNVGDKILTGSLYFASRKGALSDATLQISGLPYDIIGIIFQNKEYYVYTIINNGVETISLNSLLSDNNITNHAVLQVKETEFNEKRIEILRHLFKYYREVPIKYNLYRHLASIVGYPVIKENGYMTGPQLIGLILFQAGLIWDDRFATGNKNPVCCFDKCFFQDIAKDAEGDYEAIVSLVTPNNDWFEIEQNIQQYIDFYQEDYKHCYSKSEWIKISDCDKRLPHQKFVYTRTIIFEALRPSDFLKKTNNYYDLKPPNSPELVGMICSLATRRTDENDINRINMSWYSDILKPLCSESRSQDHNSRFEDYTQELMNIIPKLSSDFNKRYLSDLNGNLLLKICKCTSQLAAELHLLSEECNSRIKYNQDTKKEYKFKVLLDSGDRYATEYVIILNKYMWGNNWKYTWDNRIECEKSELSVRIKKLMSDLTELKNKIPVSCVILELIVYLLEQAHRLYTYTRKYRKIIYIQEDDNIDPQELIDELFL